MNKISNIDWYWYQFQQLSILQLYDLLKFRQDVFIIEQQCIYPDIDGLDPQCMHLLGYENEQLVAYLRLIPAEFHRSGNIALGRIISSAQKRRSGLGRIMMQKAIQFALKQYPAQDIQLSAQYHLRRFYQNLGFNSISEAYDEDGIQHIDMLYESQT